MACLDEPACHAPHNVLKTMVLESPVIDLCTGVLPQTDQQHLEQTALNRAGELGVGFDAVAEQHVVGLNGMPIGVDREPLGSLADDHRLQTRPNWTATHRFGDAITLDNLPLSLGRPTAVTAHCREQKRFGAQLVDDLDHRLQNAIDVGDATATHRDRHTFPRAYLLDEIQIRQLAADLLPGRPPRAAAERFDASGRVWDRPPSRRRYSMKRAWPEGATSRRSITDSLTRMPSHHPV